MPVSLMNCDVEKTDTPSNTPPGTPSCTVLADLESRLSHRHSGLKDSGTRQPVYKYSYKVKLINPNRKSKSIVKC